MTAQLLPNVWIRVIRSGNQSPRGLIDGVLRGAFGLLVAAVAINIAVNLIRCNWPWIVGIFLAGAVISGAVWWWWNRSAGW